MSGSFVARTRKRGEIDYVPAVWSPAPGKNYLVKFCRGKHAGEVLPEEECAIALESREVLERRRQEWSQEAGHETR